MFLNRLYRLQQLNTENISRDAFSNISKNEKNLNLLMEISKYTKIFLP